MSESRCQRIPTQRMGEELRTVHFVYEAEHDALKQPFLHPIYYVYLVTSGTACIEMAGKSHKVAAGDLFFSFAGCPFSTSEAENFKYLYISFVGKDVTVLLEHLGIHILSPVYSGYDHLFDLWFSAIARVNDQNAALLSEGVLRYTLSFLAAEAKGKREEDSAAASKLLLDYVNAHFNDPSLSLTRVAELFAYTEKHVSHLLKKETGTGFSQHVSALRLSYARLLILSGESSVSAVALASGYRDALYFSKVFKKQNGCTPREFIERVRQEK